MADQFFTPSEVACKLVRGFRERKNERVGDFAAGDGELLRAVARKWPGAEVVATDVDSSLVRRLKSSQPTWNIGRCDFLNAASRHRCRVLKERLGQFSLIVMNPPFGCRGAEYCTVSLGGEDARCSRAMAFITEALKFLGPDGRLAAILPSGCLSAEKDGQIWRIINRRYRVVVVGVLDRKVFPGATARAALVHLSAFDGSSNSDAQSATTRPAVAHVTIIRGSLPMHVATNGLAGSGFRLVHTTDLRNTTLRETEHSVKQERKCVIGPAVLMPRVGEPTADKCVLYLEKEKLVLSDCVYAIRCASKAIAVRVQERLLAEWATVDSFYAGTCARYITTDRLRQLLALLGISAS